MMICIKHSKESKFKNSNEILNLIDEWDKKVKFDQHYIYNLCIQYNYEDGIEKMGHSTNDYMMLFEFYIENKNYEKMV